MFTLKVCEADSAREHSKGTRHHMAEGWEGDGTCESMGVCMTDGTREHSMETSQHSMGICGGVTLGNCDMAVSRVVLDAVYSNVASASMQQSVHVEAEPTTVVDKCPV